MGNHKETGIFPPFSRKVFIYGTGFHFFILIFNVGSKFLWVYFYRGKSKRPFYTNTLYIVNIGFVPPGEHLVNLGRNNLSVLIVRVNCILRKAEVLR